MLLRCLRLFAVLLLAPAAFAGTPVDGKTEAAIRAKLGSAMSGVEITSVSTSPVPGLYEVVLDGSETAFVSADGGYLISGDLYQTTARGLVNVTDQRKSGLRSSMLAKLKPEDMITFAASGKEKGEVFVFTDVDCGYCRKLHQEVPKLNAAGITVHYLAFPRSGVQGETFQKMQGVWCSADRNKAMTEVKRGGSPLRAPVACKSPVAEQYRTGMALGVRGTPAVFLPDGNQIGGYLPAKELISEATGKTAGK
ncbi:MAG: thioredoxin fold domain-containing protein [Pseudomonadota bacterium]